MDFVFILPIIFSFIAFAVIITMTVISIIASIKNAKNAMTQIKNVSMSNEDISKTIFQKLSSGKVVQNGKTVEINEEQKRYCEYCGVAIKKDVSKCKNCGAPVKK